MNRHARRRARALGTSDAEAAAGYNRTAEVTFQLMRAFLAKSAEAPRFALLDRDIALMVSMLDHGHKFARNAAAHELVNLFVRMTCELGLRDGPTYMMVRTCVEMLGLPHDVVTVDELFPGAELRTIAGQRAGKA